jgi:hypothetical protein
MNGTVAGLLARAELRRSGEQPTQSPTSRGSIRPQNFHLCQRHEQMERSP